MSENVCPRTGKPCPHPKNVSFIQTIQIGGQEHTENVMCCGQCVGPENSLMAGLFADLMSPQSLTPPGAIGVPVPGSFALINKNALFGHGGHPAPQQPRPTLRCEACGWTPEQFAQTQSMGCQNCYHALRTWLEPLLVKLHESNVHVGKKPKPQGCCGGGCSVEPPAPKVNNRESLEARLAEAIKEERYEDAAIIRDEIRKVDGKNESYVAEQRKALQLRMDEAIRVEDYEEAARCRDALKNLDKK